MKIRCLFFTLLQILFFVACDNDDETTTPVGIDDTFNNSLQGWEGDFADYPTTPGDSIFYELNFKHANLPKPLDNTKKSIMISGNNHSDDLFMFLRKKVTGLIPNQQYDATFDIEFASNAASNHFGVGGAPGESVYIGAGFTIDKPIKVDDKKGYYRMNIKKINQANDGDEMKIIGNISNGTDQDDYVLIKRSGTFTGKADDKGEVWVIIGTDSGFEATTTLYYTHIKITFTPK